MSLVFTHNDRARACDHEGTLGRAASDGSRLCVRCGITIKPRARETFTQPADVEPAGKSNVTSLGS